MIIKPKREYDKLQTDLTLALSLIKELQIAIQLLKKGRKSDTNSTPNLQDYSGRKTIGEMPNRLTANIQYGKNVQALVAYLSVYQYLPSNRLKTFMKDVLNLPISEGTVFNILESMSKKAQPVYQEIKNRVASSTIVGGDETSAHVNKDKMWFWVFENKSLTFILASLSRGYQTIVDTFSEGFPLSVYVSDSLPAQLKIKTFAK